PRSTLIPYTTLFRSATNKYRIATTHQDIVSDGKTQWIVLKDEEEIQVAEADNSNESISPANIFSFYTTGYKYVSAPSEQVAGTPLLVIELSPENAQSPYFKIKLRIRKTTHLIYDATVFDKSGVKYTYQLKNTK